MKQLADGVWHLDTFFLPNAINAYLVGDVLIDAGTRRSGGGILRGLEGHAVSAHALTHAHPDHQGASHEVCTTLGIPYWVPDGEAEAAEDPSLTAQNQPATSSRSSSSASSRGRATRSTASCATATRSPASR